MAENGLARPAPPERYRAAGVLSCRSDGVQLPRGAAAGLEGTRPDRSDAGLLSPISDGRQVPEGKDRMSLFLVKRLGRWLITSGPAINPPTKE